MEWEEIDRIRKGDTSSYITIERSRLPQGWLVRSVRYTFDGHPIGEGALTYVPEDPSDHVPEPELSWR